MDVLFLVYRHRDYTHRRAVTPSIRIGLMHICKIEAVDTVAAPTPASVDGALVRAQNVHALAGPEVGLLPGDYVAPVHSDDQTHAAVAAVAYPNCVVALATCLEIGALHVTRVTLARLELA
jgi:hypothetical protein